MRKFYGFLAILVLASVTLSACGAAPVPESQVLCPIKYDTTESKCVFADVVPDEDTTNTLYPSLNLAQNEAAVCQAPGSEEVLEVVKGISTHLYPDMFCWKYPTNRRTLDTQQDPSTACDPVSASKNECIKQIVESVNLLGGAKGTASYQIQYEIAMNSDTPQNKELLKQAGGYVPLMSQFNDLTRRLFRESQVIDPQEEVDGTIRESLAQLWSKKLTETGGEFDRWEYNSLFKINSLVVTYFKVVGLDTASNVQLSQENQEASAFATQRAIACGDYEEDAYQLECERTFVCSQDGTTCYFGGGIIPVQTVTPENILTTPTP